MSPRLLPLLLAALSAAPTVARAAAADRPPNILFIFADDHSRKVISAYEDAYPLARTPHLDRLAASGIRFQAGYLGAWCMPSRATLLTGLHPHAIETMRMTGGNPRSTYDPAVCRFWPAAFRRHGYQTAQIGKWHTGTDAGWGRDWDYQRVWNRPANPEDAGNYYGPQIVDFNGQPRRIEGYATDNYTRWAVDYIRGEGRDPAKPWYLWLCYGAIHGPTIPAPRHRGSLRDAPVTPPRDLFGPRPGKPAYLEGTQAWKRGPAGEALDKNGRSTHADWVRQANECLQAVDEGVGEVLRALRESGQLERTLVVYSSDQGYANGEHGLKQKVAPYEASYASPFIVSQPGTIPAGKVSRHVVNGPDVIVTFFAQAGIPLPWKMHGRDFSPLLRDPDGARWDHATLFTNTGQDYGANVAATLRGAKAPRHAGVPYFAAVRHGDRKYVRYFDAREPEELYDLRADPEELTNLAADPRHRAALERLRNLWQQELQAADAKYLELLPPPASPSANGR
ncbi:MAG: sulfatase-like hydrolase/transferase [Opitutaceae bacterium]